MEVDFYKLGVALVLLGLLFPVVDFTTEYDSSETAMVTFFVWFLGVIFLFVSAFVSGRKCSCK